jgi:hypothetical protein
MGDEKPKGVKEAAKPYAPSNIDKLTLNAKADGMNFVALTTTTQKPYLGCGAKSRNKKRGDLCHMVAGQGTAHVGYGRCKYHGGNNPGPITPEGKAKVAQNSRIHGLYASVLNPREAEYFNAFSAAKDTGLEIEIYVLKAKIMEYLAKWRAKWVAAAAKEGDDVADNKTKVMYKESEGNATATAYYHAGTIEDKPLMRALETLGRLIEKQARLNPEGGTDVIDQINKELRDASEGQVTLSWGKGKAQSKAGGS